MKEHSDLWTHLRKKESKQKKTWKQSSFCPVKKGKIGRALILTTLFTCIGEIKFTVFCKNTKQRLLGLLKKTYGRKSVSNLVALTDTQQGLQKFHPRLRSKEE